MVDARVSPVLVLIWLSTLSIPAPPIGPGEYRPLIKPGPRRGYCKPESVLPETVGFWNHISIGNGQQPASRMCSGYAPGGNEQNVSLEMHNNETRLRLPQIGLWHVVTM
jgi:hypothetical protein